MKLFIDHRERHRVQYAIKRCKSWNWDYEVKELPIGDYVCGNTVVEYKTVVDYCASIFDGRLKRETINQANTFPYHFVMVVGNIHEGCKQFVTWRDYNNVKGYGNNNFYDTTFLTSVASISTYTNVMMVNDQKTAFNLMKRLFEKCNDTNKKVVLPIDKMSRNPCFNFIRGIPRISDKRANAIVDALELETLQDLVNCKRADFLTVKGIGDSLADEIMRAIKGKDK